LRNAVHWPRELGKIAARDLAAAELEPMSRILHGTVAHTYPVAARGEGIHL
jgi:hypothetical protein